MCVCHRCDRPLLGLLLVLSTLRLTGQPLPGTRELELTGDPAEQMVAGITTYLERLTAASPQNREPNLERLRARLGVVDARVRFTGIETVGTLSSPALRAETARWHAIAVRWPVLEGVTAEGLLYQPTGPTRCRIVALPDADQQPEQFEAAQGFASASCEVLVPALVDRRDTYSGSPALGLWTNQPHREWIYRMAFPVGRHIIGYEVQKVLAAVDWFESQAAHVPVAVYGEGEGGAIAFYAAALDRRIQAAEVLGFFDQRETKLWREPIYRDVFGLFKDSGDAEVATLIAPRPLIVSTEHAPSVAGPPAASQSRKGAAPGRLDPIDPASFDQEFQRALSLKPGNWLSRGSSPAALLGAIGIEPVPTAAAAIAVRDAGERMKRQVSELVDYTQQLVIASETWRDDLWKQAGPDEVRRRFVEDVIGVLPDPPAAPDVWTRRSYASAKWIGYEVLFDVRRDVFGYGVLLFPKDMRPGEKRPLVVVQHGLNGRAQWLFEAKEGRPLEVYRNFAAQLADRGYVVYVPQNPYTGDFRHITRLAHPLGLTLYSIIQAQNRQMLDWLVTLPQVDASRIGYYGLSYGGKTALRVPPFDERFKVAVCGGDFNAWIRKLTTLTANYSYMFTEEFELLEWNMASVASHAELAKLMAPRGFMVERGHRDGVGTDEWVSYEYAKVRRYYDEQGWGDRTTIAFFNGPHRVDGPAAIDFLEKFLGTVSR